MRKEKQERDMRKIKLLSLFSGIGAFEKALDNIGAGYELVNYCEIDKYASKSYAMIHGCSEAKNLGDITKVDTAELPEDIDMVTYGFPCQDISNAGKMKGFGKEGNRTRSGLFFEALRIIEDKQPRIAICENVKNLTSKRFKNEFEIVLQSLEEAGYNNYWKVMNAKDYGIPQNRERVFIVSIRKDLDKGTLEFPQPIKLKMKLKDFLENEVEEKYFINEKRVEIIKRNLGNVFEENFVIGSSQKNAFVGNESIAPSLTNAMGAGGGQTPMIKCIDKSVNDTKEIECANCITAREDRGISNRKKEGTAILVREATKKGYAEAYEGDSINLEHPNSETRRGRVGKETAQTLTTSCNQGVVNKELRVRKLTPRECFRLMGFSDEDFDRITGISNTQLYKQAGNSIVVKVLEFLLKEVFAAVDLGSGPATEKTNRTEIEVNGKLLIFRIKGVATPEEQKTLQKRLKEQITDGVMVLDERVEYEIV